MESKKPAKAKLFDIKHLPMDFGRFICTLLPFVFRLKKIYVSKEAKKKIKGGALIAANHTCFADPLLIGCTFWYRRMFFLTAEAVMQTKMRPLLKGIGCIEINRTICDMDAIRKTVSVLKEGHVVSVFPQGGIEHSDDIKNIKSGISLMAMQAGVPVIPVYVHHRRRFWQRNYAVIGEPVTLLKTEKIAAMSQINSFSDTVSEKMNECKKIYEQARSKKDGNNSKCE